MIMCTYTYKYILYTVNYIYTCSKHALLLKMINYLAKMNFIWTFSDLDQKEILTVQLLHKNLQVQTPVYLEEQKVLQKTLKHNCDT